MDVSYCQEDRVHVITPSSWEKNEVTVSAPGIAIIQKKSYKKNPKKPKHKLSALAGTLVMQNHREL